MISKRSYSYCYEVEKIENYEQAMNDKINIWDCHHRYEIHEGKVVKRGVLKRRGLLYNRPAEELIFLRKEEHMRLHSENITEEHRKKISASNTGKHHTEETRKKISEAHKGKTFSEEHLKKIVENRHTLKGDEHPLYGKPRSEETRIKISNSSKGKHRVYNEDGTYHLEY